MIFYQPIYFTTQTYGSFTTCPFISQHNILTFTCPFISQHKSTDLLPVHLFHNTKYWPLPVHLFHNTKYWPLSVHLFHNTKYWPLPVHLFHKSTDLLPVHLFHNTKYWPLVHLFLKSTDLHLSIYFTTQSTAKPGEYKWVSSANSTQCNWRRLQSEMLGFFLPVLPLIIIWSQYLFPRHDSTQA